MDKFIEAYIRVNVHIDAGQRVFCDGQELKVHLIGGVQKVALPPHISKQTFTFDDLKLFGAKCDVVSVKSLALAGAEGRWRTNIEARKGAGLPSNVYIANARSIAYAIEKGKSPMAATYIGRKRDQCTEVYGTVDEVIDAMANGNWRTEFAKGGKAKRRAK